MSDAPRQPPPKKEVALALLEESSMFIHLDPRRPDVNVPKAFLGQPQLVLQVGLNMAIPIPDLKIEETGLSCTLSFNRSPFWCFIPWSAVYALVGEDGRGGVWADDVPPEIQQQKPSGPPPKTTAKRPRPKLTVAGSGQAGGRSSAPGSQPGGRPSAPADQRPSAPASQPPAADDDGNEPRSPARAKPPAVSPVRRVLAAVPSHDDGIVEDEPPPRDAVPLSPLPALAAAPPAEEPAAGPTQTPGGKKPKREIPPYLRRIK